MNKNEYIKILKPGSNVWITGFINGIDNAIDIVPGKVVSGATYMDGNSNANIRYIINTIPYRNNDKTKNFTIALGEPNLTIFTSLKDAMQSFINLKLDMINTMWPDIVCPDPQLNPNLNTDLNPHKNEGNQNDDYDNQTNDQDSGSWTNSI